MEGLVGVVPEELVEVLEGEVVAEVVAELKEVVLVVVLVVVVDLEV